MNTAPTRCTAALSLVMALGLVQPAHAAASYATDTFTSASTYTASGTGSAAIAAISGVAASNATAGTFNPTTGATVNLSSGITGNWINSTSDLGYVSAMGLTMTSDGSNVPNHAVDNGGVNTEGVLLNFASKQNLSSVTLGYTSNNTYTGSTLNDCGGTTACASPDNLKVDVSVWAYTGASTTPTLAGAGASGATMTADGWSLIGNYGSMTNGDNAVNASGVSSSWWLITAYNTSFGTTSADGGTLTQGDDYFKIYSVAACTANCSSKVPEPGSLALASLAFLGVIYSRRGRQNKR